MRLLNDLRWAWRGITGRGWRALLVVGLLALALAANTAIFAVADALVFNPYPYPNPERIVTLTEALPEGTSLTKAQASQRFEEWRKQSDIFTAAGGFLQKTLFVTSSGSTEQVRAADVTIGLLDVLGVKPQWGRPFVAGDESGGEFAILISANLARKYFGSPSRAPGQVLSLTAGPHRVVGVMPEDFAFPQASYEIWRALDPAGPLTRNFGAVGAMARVAPGLSNEELARRLTQRAPIVGAALGLPSYAVTAVPQFAPSKAGARETLVLVLLGAALCLLLATCANVASLELASAIGRARTYAVRLALGASRGSLARVAALEGGLLIGAAVVLGIGLIWVSSTVLLAMLPDWLRFSGQNRIGLDVRAFGYTTLVAMAAWIAAAMPPVIAASRPDLVALLRLEDRGAAVSRAGARLRQVLTAAEIAVAVTLVIGGLLYTRSYQDLLAVEKGFDSTGLAALRWTVPNGHFATAADRADARRRFAEAIAAVPGVMATTSSSPPPSTGDSPGSWALEIDDRPPLTQVPIGANWVDATYFSVVRLPLKSGQTFAADSQATDVVISEMFAKRFWPGIDAVGHSFRQNPKQPWNRVIGVVGDFRSAATRMPAETDRALFFYKLVQPAPPSTAPAAAPPAAPPPPLIDTGGSYGFIPLTIRMDSPARAPQVLAAAKALDPQLRVTFELVDDVYARQNAETRLASQVVGGFSVLAFMVAIAGIYGLMAFLVGSRRREIGVRMALGADQADIRRLVFGSAARLVLVGAAVGVAGAVLAARSIASALFGVTATDPLTYVVVVVSVVIAALAATWHPAREAARVDPAKLLRAD